MGKPKKGTKGHQKDEDSDDLAGDLEQLNIGGNSEANEESKPAQSKKNKKKKKKNENDAVGDSDDVNEDTLKGKESEEDEDEASSRRPAKSAFELLADMDGGDEDEKPEDEPDTEDKEEKPQVANEPKTSKDTKKKKKDKGKKKKADDDDIDAILAEIEDKKPKENFKDVSAMTQDEIAKMLEAEYDDEEEEKKKKKKKKKKGEEKPVAAEDKSEEMDEKDKETVEGDEDQEFAMKSAAQKKKEKKEREKQKRMEEKLKGKGKKDEQQTEEKKDDAGEEQEEGEKKKKKKPRKKKKGQDEEEQKEEKAGQETVAAADQSSAEAQEKKEDEGEDEKNKEEGEEDKEGSDDEEGSSTKKKPAKKKKGPSKMVQMIKEQQRKLKEEEERLKKEEEERIQREEEAQRLKEEKLRLEKERKEKEKQKKKDKIARQKAEGTFLTAKQKEDQRRAQAMLEQLRQQGIDVPLPGEKASQQNKKKVVYTNKKKKPVGGQAPAEAKTPEEKEEKIEEEKVTTPEEETKTPEKEEVADSWEMVEEDDGVKDAWDAESEEEPEPEEAKEKPKAADQTETTKAAPTKAKPTKEASVEESEEEDESSEEEDSSEEESSEEESSEEESESESESDDGTSKAEQQRQKVLDRIKHRREAAEKKRSTDVLRAPVVCVLGHVDTGKTKILDKLRRTHVQDGEAGGITQQIGATNVPREAIVEQTKMCKEFVKQELKLPGMLIIDTPGHESFSNLRNRGSSLCDIAILVVDIMHGLEPQTLESMKLLREKKCPFVVALNKIDRLYGWQTNPHNDVVNTLKKQKQNTRIEFEERAQHIIVQFAEQSINAALFHENKNPREFISLVPTSAHSGDGMGNLIALLCELSQNHLQKRLAYCEELEAMVMEVKALPGLGTTVDIILVNGKIKEGDQIIVPGTEGPIVTQIRGLLMPQPMKELRVKATYDHFKEVRAAQGVKLIAKDLEKAVAGLPIYVAQQSDEVEIYKDELKGALEEILSSIKLSDKGVFVQSSTLGSLEALLQFLRDSKIPYAGINIGPVHKRDVMKSSVMLEHDAQYAVILAFDVKVERDAQELADNQGIRIFQADIIYHLFDAFTDFVKEYKKKKQDEFRHLAVFPCKLRIIPQFIFNSRDPIVVGVSVEEGFLKVGAPLCVPSKEFIYLGNVTSIEINHKPVEKATKGQEVCIKIENVPGETPKLYGRHFDFNDLVISKISRATIDAVKDHFREEMTKPDWQLIVELKKLFEII